MDPEQLTRDIARNITYYRKMAGLTQSELAELLTYSDKSISKWERGEGVPDVHVMMRMAEAFGVTMNDLVAPETAETKEVRKPIKERTLIPMLSMGLVYLVVAICFFIIKLAAPDMERAWLVFLYGLPISCIVLIVFMNLWWNNFLRCLSVSALIWSFSVCIVCTLPQMQSIHFIFIIAAVMQILTILWYLLIAKPRRKG